LFTTATPRVYKTGLKKAAEEFGVEVVDMSDEKSFGKRFHTFSFGKAIKLGWLTDYRVLIVGVDNDARRNGLRIAALWLQAQDSPLMPDRLPVKSVC
jgi:predicted helicase